MKYSVKSEIYKEGMPFNKWFQFESDKCKRVNELIIMLGLETDKIGLVIINNIPTVKNIKLNDRDNVRFVGKIYSEYL